MLKNIHIPSLDELVGIGFSKAEAEGVQQRARFLRDDCGCVSGAAGLLLGLILYPFFWLLLFPKTPLWFAFFGWLLVAVAASGIGKYSSISISKIRLRKLMRILDKRMGARSASYGGARG